MEINQKNKNGLRQGYWETLIWKGHYKNGIPIGYWKCYYKDIIEKDFYFN